MNSSDCVCLFCMKVYFTSGPADPPLNGRYQLVDGGSTKSPVCVQM